MIEDYHELRIRTMARKALETECAAVRRVLGDEFHKTQAEVERIALRRMELRERKAWDR
jgi:hypothetical protein